MKILVIGASGLIGWNLYLRSRLGENEVVGTYKTHKLGSLIPLDLSQEEKLADLIKFSRPDLTFFCAGWTWVDGCESDPNRAYRENTEQPATAAKYAKEAGSHFVYFSTSYVFHGLNGPYLETDAPCPLSVYGKSKWLGEQKVSEVMQGKAVIARTMGVYGPEPQQKNFVYQVRKSLSAGLKLRVANDQYGNISYAPHLAEMAFGLAERKQSGVWNLAGKNPCLRRSDFAMQIAEAYGLPMSLIEPVETSQLKQAAIRPKQGGLIVDKITNFASLQSEDWVRLD